jgi:rare lipoprotein A
LRAARVAAPRGLAAAAAIALAACAHRGPAPEAPPPRAEREPPRPPEEEGPRPPQAEVGVASFYGKRFHGRKTASGVRYDMHAMTCAHRTLPFGARLRVTDLETGRSVEVTVTDRGPFARGRVVDLSLAAARRLGMESKGLARVRVERIGGEPEDRS